MSWLMINLWWHWPLQDAPWSNLGVVRIAAYVHIVTDSVPITRMLYIAPVSDYLDQELLRTDVFVSQ